MKSLLATVLLLACHATAVAEPARVFVLADNQGQRRQYVAYEQQQWPAAEAERHTFAAIASALDKDRTLGVMMIAPDPAAEERAARALRRHLAEKQRRLAIRHRVGALAPGVLYGRLDR